MQFVNIAVVILIVNFRAFDEKVFGFLPIMNGTYPDFNSYWYGQVGETLCLTLFINMASPHVSKLLLPFLKLFLRFWDRGCKRNLFYYGGKTKEEEFFNQRNKKTPLGVRTKKHLMTDLTELYTGGQISSHYVFA
jgi:hypothetical protein